LKKGDPPWQFFLKALTPLGILAKNIRYPLPWIFNLCASMKVVIMKRVVKKRSVVSEIQAGHCYFKLAFVD
jgi:hypothetical protein